MKEEFKVSKKINNKFKILKEINFESIIDYKPCVKQFKIALMKYGVNKNITLKELNDMPSDWLDWLEDNGFIEAEATIHGVSIGSTVHKKGYSDYKVEDLKIHLALVDNEDSIDLIITDQEDREVSHGYILGINKSTLILTLYSDLNSDLGFNLDKYGTIKATNGGEWDDGKQVEED